VSEAEDAVQEAWLRLDRSEASSVENLAGWLTTVVARVCLDMLRSRKSRREDPLAEDADALAPVAGDADAPDRNLVLADSISLALLVVLETLEPAERVAFVLHDMFDVPFDQIAPIVGRTPTATRQLASRARRRVRGAEATGGAERGRQREIVEAFLAASRENDFAALLAVLDPDVVLRADRLAVEGSIAARETGAPVLAPEIRGAKDVAEAFAGRARTAQLALVGGAIGLAWAPGGSPRVAFRFAVTDERIVGIELTAAPEALRELAVTLL
jgi:RNA polymerase sigma-70 factor (ECF subfamily)